MWFSDFLEKLFPTRQTSGGSTIVLDIPAELYYKELAVYTATSLIGNAIARSEIKVYQDGKAIRNEDYFLLNIAPNANETSTLLWHKVINKMVREGSALVVEAAGKLYCAENYTVEEERPVLGDIYSGIKVGNMTFNRKFNQKSSYLFRMDDYNITQLINGMHSDYGKVLTSAAKAFRNSNGRKYKIHINGLKAGDKNFNEEFEEIISEQIKEYLQSENAVYPEFDGYELKPDENSAKKDAEDFLKLLDRMQEMVFTAFHIPSSLMKGNVVNTPELVEAALTFAVDPFADAIQEALNKRGGADNFASGNFYKVDTGRILHRDLFKLAADVSNLISSGFANIDEVREELGWEPCNEEWSKKHYITKNFMEIEGFAIEEKGGKT